VVVFNGSASTISVKNHTIVYFGSNLDKTNPVNAEFDDIKIFNKSLTQTEIVQISLENL
jgi:hypothetical protein